MNCDWGEEGNGKEEGRRLTGTGDTKYGRLVGTDAAGNKFFENTDELPRKSTCPLPRGLKEY